MKNIYNALMLKKLLIQKELGAKYIGPLKEFKEEQVSLPNTIESLRGLTLNCHLCELSKTRQNVVFGDGNTDADLMFIGEAPGASEDSKGTAVAGRSGELLTKMIENVLHIPRDSVYIANIVKCKPPQNRQISSNEAEICKPFLMKQIEIIKPKLIVALGATAYQYLSNDDTPINKIRGHILTDKEYSIIPTYHPNYLLRNPSAKKEAFEDMLKVKSFLGL